MRWAMLAVMVGCGALMGAAPGVPGTGAGPAPAAPTFIYPAEGGGGNGPLPPEMSANIEARMRARRLVMVAQVLATVSMGVMPENVTVTTSTIEAESTTMAQGGVGGQVIDWSVVSG